MRTVEITHTPTTFFLPADELRAAYQCVSSEETRYYLRGVYIDSISDLLLVGLDGDQMLTIELPQAARVGSDCNTQDGGFILSCDVTDKAFKAKGTGGDLWVYGDVTTGIMQFVVSDGMPGPVPRAGVLEFERIDGTFPDWRRVVASGDGSMKSIAYAPAVMQKLVKAGDVIEKGKPIRLSGTGPTDPIRVDFAASPRLRGTIMPVRQSSACGHWS